jgi:gliding motility-associated-like protein
LSADRVSGCVPYCANYTFVATNGSKGKVGSQWKTNNTLYSNVFSYCFAEAGNIDFTGVLIDSITGCRSTEKFTAVVYSKPKADFEFTPANPTIVDEINFKDVSQSASNYQVQWYVGTNDKYTVKSSRMSYLFQESGAYAVAMTIRDSQGCSDTIVKNILVDEDFAAYVPNAFSPNADHLNEYFYPVLRSIRFYTLEVYDRWGTRVYKGTQNDAGWDGTYQGKNCPQGVYTWIINVSSKDGKSRALDGHVTVLR